MVSFSDAVKICLTKKYATMSGRASRAEFWWFQLFIWVTDICLFAISSALADNIDTAFIVTLIFSVLTLIPYLCVFVRRLHDRGFSGGIFWWAFLISIWGVILVGLIINIFGSVEGTNEYGPNPNGPINDDSQLNKENQDDLKSISSVEKDTEITDVNL
jgi:uncharacterized membrane protein YhaH (DUF805 family)